MLVGIRIDELCRASGAKVDVGQVVAHFPDVVTSAIVVRGTGSELAVGVAPPASDRVVVAHDADVVLAAGHRLCGSAGSEVDRVHVVAHLPDAIAEIVGDFLTQLAVVVVAPTFEGVVVENRTAPSAGRVDPLSGSSGSQVDRVQSVAHLPAAIADVVGVPLAELAGAAFAPALDRVVVEDRAGV